MKLGGAKVRDASLVMTDGEKLLENCGMGS